MFLDNGGDSVEDGGAIYVVGAIMSITLSIFQTNSASKSGGALYLSSGTYTLTDTLFRGNSADDAAAFYTYGTSMTASRVNVFGNDSDDPPNCYDGDSDDEYSGVVVEHGR